MNLTRSIDLSLYLSSTRLVPKRDATAEIQKCFYMWRHLRKCVLLRDKNSQSSCFHTFVT